MNKYNTLFGQLLGVLGRSRFDSLVKKYDSDKYCNGNATWMQLTAMLYAQITDANGLRSIENAFARNSSASYHLGLDRKIKRSSLSYANNTRDCSIFYELFTMLSSELTSGGRRKMKKLFAVDATVISLNKNDYGWADFREAKIEFVTRMKSGVLYKVVRENAVTDKNIGFDRIIQFTGRETSKECPDELRLIESTDPETGKTIVILTNMKGHAAKFVAGLYKKRWQVELFFKAVKQNLHIKRFYGKSENAVFIQVYIAMIAYVLFMLLKKKSEMTGLCFTHFIDMMKVNLFTRTDLLLWLCGKIQKPSFPDLDRLQTYLPFA